ncbi:MAG: GTPase HflX [Desulfobacteraceae bacterium 4572_130]|nr:MAG: GTPase HflX [Desulfobacteraceae bacterium 4572_130]
MKKIWGNTSSLKARQIKQLENLYLFKTPPEHLISKKQLNELTSISNEIRRQIGLLINRAGKTEYVIIGDAHKIVIPVTFGYQAIPGKLKGLRCIHTHIANELLSIDDLTDLALLRLDLMAAVIINKKGVSEQIYISHILPKNNKIPYQIMEPVTIHNLSLNCIKIILELESEISQQNALYKAGKNKEKALLINVITNQNIKKARESLDELTELCKTSGIRVIDTVIQKRKKIDSKFVVGHGKLAELTIRAIGKYATMIIFDKVLSPSQIRSITDFIEMKVIDRTQLILDIFAKHAKSREGKFQVELAQMKYLLPRLVTKNTAMSRLTGGIGGRGPGETKLEINRRRVRNKIEKLKKDIAKIRKQRTQQRAQRNKNKIPIISIVGYTNAGKSTLLNTLTQSKITVGNKFFATLDPSSRRLKFSKNLEVIITDTVGFIQDLPNELMDAFNATLEELKDATILLHIIDISNPRYKQQMLSVEKILQKLKIDSIPILYAFNKQDKIDLTNFDDKWFLNQGTLISATKKETLKPLISRLESMIITQLSQK